MSSVIEFRLGRCSHLFLAIHAQRTPETLHGECGYPIGQLFTTFMTGVNLPFRFLLLLESPAR